jgi:hypothetical protein
LRGAISRPASFARNGGWGADSRSTARPGQACKTSRIHLRRADLLPIATSCGRLVSESEVGIPICCVLRGPSVPASRRPGIPRSRGPRRQRSLRSSTVIGGSISPRASVGTIAVPMAKNSITWLPHRPRPWRPYRQACPGRATSHLPAERGAELAALSQPSRGRVRLREVGFGSVRLDPRRVTPTSRQARDCSR